MSHDQIQDLNVHSTDRLVSPEELKVQLPSSDAHLDTVREGRRVIQDIMLKQDPRLLVIAGPCSIHDSQAALEYAGRLQQLHDEFKDRMYLVMRTYFEKPRTTVGWKGLIYDPDLDDSGNIAKGLYEARKLLLEVTGNGLPTATEFLDPIVPQYIGGLVCWAAIGARTTESQTHRQMASGLSMPVGFKNATDGGLQVAIDAMGSSMNGHYFLGIDTAGKSAVIHTRGNAFGHVVLRGGNKRTNYDKDSIQSARERLAAADLNPIIMVDCSHANSGKKAVNQPEVWNQVIDQRRAGDDSIIGLMLESHLSAGNQKLKGSLSDLKYGVSITDECLDWENTETLLRQTYQRLG
ncbi:MAG: 3-deoxy-7-phosphoheptulonate synthase [Verrucomicrobiota bacterium]